MNRYIRFLCLAIAAGFWGIPAVAQSRESEIPGVYTEVLDALYQTSQDNPPFVVVRDSIFPRTEGISEHGTLIAQHTSVIDPGLVADFELRTSKGRPWPMRFSYHLPIKFFSIDDLRPLDSMGTFLTAGYKPNDVRVQPFWYGFLARYEGAWGLTVLSDVGFNPTLTEALVFVRHNYGSGQHSEVMFLKRAGARWNLVERISNDALENAGFGSLRYLGPNAHMIEDRRRIEASSKMALEDSLARAKLPRRIRGTITNGQTGRPIPFAQVLLFQANPDPHAKPDSIPHPNQRVVADRRGRFTISNPAVGGAMLVILCPGKVYFDRPSLGAPGLYVWPGSDTTFNFAAQDLSACWYPTKLHQLASGWFESAESRNASVPDDDEAAVFATVIDHLKAKSPDKRIVAMFTRTMLACRYSKRCGTAQLARLVHEHTIDSTTFNEFRLRSATQSILKPDFARSIGLHVITDQEFHYLSGEAASPIGWPARDESTDSTQFWTSFKKLNGSDASIISLTRAGFNAARTEAIVEARVVSGYSQFERATWPMMRLRKSGSTWQIEDEDVGKGVTTGEWAGGKCEPVSPTGDVKWLDALKLNGEFRIVVVSTAGNLYTAKYRVHIGRNEPRMHPTREGPRNMGPFTFEAHDENGKYDEAGTLDLRFFAEGTEIPRNTDMIMLDGYHHYLTIRRITESGFAGSFSAGVFVDDAAGHFCAERINP